MAFTMITRARSLRFNAHKVCSMDLLFGLQRYRAIIFALHHGRPFSLRRHLHKNCFITRPEMRSNDFWSCVADWWMETWSAPLPLGTRMNGGAAIKNNERICSWEACTNDAMPESKKYYPQQTIRPGGNCQRLVLTCLHQPYWWHVVSRTTPCWVCCIYCSYCMCER